MHCEPSSRARPTASAAERLYDLAASGWLPSFSFGGPMTAAAITGHWTFRGLSDRSTARTSHSRGLSHRGRSRSDAPRRSKAALTHCERTVPIPGGCSTHLQAVFRAWRFSHAQGLLASSQRFDHADLEVEANATLIAESLLAPTGNWANDGSVILRRRQASLVDRHTGLLDHTTPLRDLVTDKAAEGRRIHVARHVGAQTFEAFLDLGSVENLHHMLIQ